ncbi:uncharacterized protein LOC105159767 [Sesamum indicum]|uniref:Uncharacterized protein LOC105159767 n=1 Tax=Sesamum indicum TaxID=4182 RepID=A0A8M8UY39_SESIN|nr:uncharacterized protein LOC105159767 [Sesamum indicum]
MALLQGWELLPDPDDHGSLQIHDHGLNTSLLHMDYFICPPQSIHPHQPPPPIPNLQLQDHHPLITKTPLPIINITPPDASPKINKSFTTTQADQQHHKFNETGFMMRLDSNTTWVIMPQPQIDGAALLHSQENQDPCKADSKTPVIKKNNTKLPFELEGGFNIWKWSFNGLGAICSFGVAAATFCLIIFSTHRNKKHPHRNQSLQFQIYNTNKQRMKQVIHQASKLNEAGRGDGSTTFRGGGGGVGVKFV